MAYEVTASRRRPSGFEELVGQEFVVSTIKNSIKAGRIAHAYLFSGPRGVGKTSAARILAKAVNCENGPTPEPCGVCSNCTEIAKGNALDVIEIDGASNTSVNDIREIKDEVLFAPNSCRYKVYIIDEVHMLSNSAFNALLKTIEEPPPYIIFIFATTEIHKVPATIRSRCQQFNFRLIGLERIKKSLSDACREMNVAAEDDALFWIAKEATGSMRDAYTLFDQVVAFSDGNINLEIIREKLGLVGLDSMNTIAEAMAGRNAAEVIRLCSEIIAGGVSVEQFAVDLAEYFRSLLFIKSGADSEALLGYAKARYSDTAVRTFSRPQLEKALELIFKFYRDVRYSLNERFELELLLSLLSDISTWISPAEIYDRLEALKSSAISGAKAVPVSVSAVQSVAQPSAPVQAQVQVERPVAPAAAAPSAPAQPVQLQVQENAEQYAPQLKDEAPAVKLGRPEPQAQPFGQAPAQSQQPSVQSQVPPVQKPAVSGAFDPDDYDDDEEDEDYYERFVDDPPVSEPPAQAAAPAKAAPSAVPTSMPSAPSQTAPVYASPEPTSAAVQSTVAGSGGGFSSDEKSRILEGIRKRKLTLAAAVEQSVRWTVNGGKLCLSFENGYTASVVKNDRQVINEIINEQTGRSYQIEVEVVKINRDEESGQDHQEHVDAVKKVFRGQVIQGGE